VGKRNVCIIRGFCSKPRKDIAAPYHHWCTFTPPSGSKIDLSRFSGTFGTRDL
jgi:hypothetical protein